MSRLRININGVKQSASSLTYVRNNITDIRNKLNNLRYGLDQRIMYRNNMYYRFNDCINRLDRISNKIDQIKNVSTNAADKYESTNSSINFRATTIKMKGLNLSGFITPNMKPFARDNNIMRFQDGTLFDFTKPINVKKGSQEYKQYLDNINKQLSKLDKTIGDTKNFLENYPKEVREKIKDACTYNIEKSIGGSLYEGNFDVQGDLYSASGNIVLGEAEAHLKGEAGLWVMDKDGKLKFNPNVEAEIGASVCAVRGELEGELGNEYLNTHASLEGKAGEASAEARLKAGLFDEEGNLDVSAKVDLNLEAIAAEADVTAGVTVLGTDLDAKAGVVVGAGAHASIGYEDGVLSCDIGAAIGVGLELSLELDMGGTIDMVNETIDKAVDGAIDFVAQNVDPEILKAVSDTVDKTIGEINNAVDTVTTAVGDAVDTVTTAVGNAVDTVTTAVGEAVDTVTTAVGNAVDTVKGAAESAVDSVKGVAESVWNWFGF